MEITGKISVAFVGKGTKSEGQATNLTTPEGETYRLYTANQLPQDDEFLMAFDGQTVKAVGTYEAHANLFCVEEVMDDAGMLHTPAFHNPFETLMPLYVQTQPEVKAPQAQPTSALFKKMMKQARKQIKNRM